MQPGVVALRGAVTAAWADDLRAVRQDSFDTGTGKEALAFIQRFYSLVSLLRAPIRRAWAAGVPDPNQAPKPRRPGRGRGVHIRRRVFEAQPFTWVGRRDQGRRRRRFRLRPGAVQDDGRLPTGGPWR